MAQEIAGPGNQEESWNNNCAEVIGPAIGAEVRERMGNTKSLLGSWETVREKGQESTEKQM